MITRKKLIVSTLAVIVLLGVIWFFTTQIVSVENQENVYPVSEIQGEQGDANSRVSRYETISFVDEDTFRTLSEIYAGIDFGGEFSSGDTEVHDLYKRQFLRLLEREATFFDRTTHREYYIDGFNEMDFTTSGGRSTFAGHKDTYDPRNYIYYFFDANGDGTPKLAISDGVRFIYIIKYDSDSDRFILWHEISATRIRPLGTRKLYLYSGNFPVDYAFFYLDQYGEVEYSLWFYIAGYHDTQESQDVYIYMVSLPIFTDESRNIQISESMEKQAFIDERNNRLYFRVTEEQWGELTRSFFDARRLAEEKIQDVRFTFEELFGSLL